MSSSVVTLNKNIALKYVLRYVIPLDDRACPVLPQVLRKSYAAQVLASRYAS